MIRKILFFCLLVLVSCEKEKSVPADVIEEDEMTSILLSIHVMEAKVLNNTKRVDKDSTNLLATALKEDILEKHNVTDSVFKESLTWYFANPEVLDRVYTRVLDSLNLKVQQTQEQKQEKEKPKSGK